MASTVDLHIHTTASDGSDSPARLLENLHSAGITTFAITDHDTIDGSREMEALVTTQFRFLRGIEFSCITPAGKCHILGYGFDWKDPVFLDALELGKNLRREKLQVRLDYLKSTLALEFAPEDIQWLRSLNSPGKPHFGQLLVKYGFAPDISTAIQKYVSPCPVPRDRIDGEIAIRAILHAGGIPVWAHPLGGEGEKRLTAEQFDKQLSCLLALGIRGMECRYSRYTPEEADFLTLEASRRELLISGGSDYHGANKRDLPLGRLSASDDPISPSTLTILSRL